MSGILDFGPGPTVAANDNGCNSPAAYRTSFTGNNEWYTPARYVELAREVMGGIDVDPASNEYAQRTVKAGKFYTAETNGLDKEWHGKVWMNPPYSQPLIMRFSEKIVAEYRCRRVTEAIVLTHNSTDTRWYSTLNEAASAVCLTVGRIKFVSPAGKFAAPAMGQVFTYFGNRPEVFASIFSEAGNAYAPLCRHVRKSVAA